MVALTPSLFLVVVSAGAVGVGFLSIIAGVVGFNDESWYHEGKIGLKFAMKFDLIKQESWFWVRSPWPMVVHTGIGDMVKIEDNGDEKSGGLSDLLPMGSPTYGKGQVKFEMYSLDDSAMPDLRIPDQIAPAIFIAPASKPPEILRYMMIGNAMILNNWGLVQFGIMAWGVMLIVGGTGLIGLSFLTRKDKNAVVDLKTAEKEEAQ